MTEPRLKTDLWIRAQIRLCDTLFIPAVIARRGDSDAGQVMIKRNLLDGRFYVFARTVTLEGEFAWRRATGPTPVDEDAANDLIDREVKFDPDVWVLEIEDPKEKYKFDGPIIG